MMDIGFKIKGVRTSMNYSRKAFSELTGLSAGYIEEIESNKKNPTIETLFKITTALNITLSDFFKDDSSQLSTELSELLTNAKTLTPEQLKKLTEFIKTMK